MKKTLIGFANNIGINFSKIKVWSQSFKKYCSVHDIYLIVANASEQEIELLNSLDIKIYPILMKDTSYINHKRLIYTYNLLSNIDTDIVLVTDVFDVVFQNDPFLKIDTDKYDIFLTLEGIKVSEEPWNADVIKKIFPEYLNICLNKNIICSGIICGKKEHLLSLLQSMYFMCEQSNNDHDIKDQAALIVLDALKAIHSRIKYFDLDDGWVINCAVAGPTQFFESWGFKNIISNKFNTIPYMQNEFICIDNKKYDIVHQFNRIPEWNKEIVKSYE